MQVTRWPNWRAPRPRRPNIVGDDFFVFAGAVITRNARAAKWAVRRDGQLLGEFDTLDQATALARETAKQEN